MNAELSQLSRTARQAVQARDWATVGNSASRIMRQEPGNAEGYYLAGLAAKFSDAPRRAMAFFEQALALDGGRYDAAVELANQYSVARRNGDAAALLAHHRDVLSNSPFYLDLAGTVYTNIGMSAEAWPLFKRANELQPGVDMFQANLAACSVFVGRIDEAAAIYRALLDRFPGHRKNHYELARLKKARDFAHIDEMKQLLRASEDPPDRQIFLYYAIGKELEDLEQWEESFDYYRKGGDAARGVSRYDVAEDVELIDTIIESCSAEWLADRTGMPAPGEPSKTPIFIVGLPRTGTTLTERIVSSHSQVRSLGETLFLQMVLRRESGVGSVARMSPGMIRAMAAKDARPIATGYMDAVAYRMGDEPMFIDKLPFNFLYLGFIAKAWPHARIVHQVRNPMDSCFSMYKQVFTWAYGFSYSLADLGRYYVAHERLRRHWREVLGDRLIEVEYEEMVADQETQTRRLLDRLGLEFEPACLDFHKNVAPSATASSVQVREKVHRGSVRRWTRFAEQLQPLREHLEKAGIRVE